MSLESHPGEDRTADIWGERTPYRAGDRWPDRVDVYLEPGVGAGDVERWVQSACLFCSNGCGVDVAVAGGRMVGMRGRVQDRVNHGRLGPKGLFGWQGQQRDRLTHPLVRRDGELVETDWDTAMSLVVERSRSLLDERGPLTHGFYTSGQLMLEEYYTLAVIGKAGLGTPHMDGNTRLCTATAAAALKESLHRRATGQLHRHRPLRRPVPLRPQHRRDPDRPVVAHARPPRRRGSSPAGLRGSPAHRGRQACHRAPSGPRGNEPGTHERPGA